MHIGFIGLGRMGFNMVKRLLKGGHSVTVFNRSKEKIEEALKEGAIASFSIEELVNKLPQKKVIWLMLPAGNIVDEYIEMLSKLLSKGDILIDGGNSFYKEDIRRFSYLNKLGIDYLDAGVSGGVWGLNLGYCTMIGGDKNVFSYIEPLLKTLSPESGYMYIGPAGAGHFVKMIHNGIEYALMGAYGEGFEILKASQYSDFFNLKDIAKLWNKGSVIRSWLLELLENAFLKDPNLSEIKGYSEDSGEARWTVNEAVENGVSAELIAISLFKRFKSRQENAFSDKVIAALRNEFGGHKVIKINEQVDKSEIGAGKFKHSKPEN